MSELAFIDSETRSLADLPLTGAYKYAKHPSTEGIVWGYIFDDEPGNIWSPAWAWGNANGSKADIALPERLLDYVAEGGFVVAWNAFFDRHIWNEVMVKKYHWPVLPLEQVLCAQAQAEANNLPGKLEKACEALGTSHKKDPKGRQLIQQLSTGDKATWNSEIFETPAKMGHFRSYCLKDCLAMRDVWQYTRPLTASEWDEYHASERINDRGVMVDVPFARAAQGYALIESTEINADLLDLTGDPKLTVTNHVRKAKWLHDELWPSEELQELTKRPQKEPGKDRFSGDRATRDAVLEMIMLPEYAELFDDEHLDEIVEFIELIEAGNSAAVRKFTAIVNQEVDNRVYGSYSFNGAGQTGRFSSRGIQVHNLIRSPVEKGNPDRAIDAIEDIMKGEAQEFLVDKYGFPVSRLLARLIRPTFIAPEGKTLVWADWDQIEARILPWLSRSNGGNDKLDLFRMGHDVYKYAAQPIFKLSSPDDADDHQRQVGKVAELALGFGGAVGAFSAMGRGYGVVLPAEDARDIVTTWRANNSWCVNFWRELWDAAMAAFNYPGEWYRAGRVRYLYHPNLMRGTLICELPDGRWLVYPQFKHERVQYICEKTTARHEKGDFVDEWRTSFVKGFGSGYGRVDLWYGTLCIAEGTEVLTDIGWLPIEQITDEMVWDGGYWVSHDGLARNGKRGTIQVFGVSMTPDHLVLTEGGWYEGSQAQRDRLNRRKVRLPTSFSAIKNKTKSLALALFMYLPKNARGRRKRFTSWLCTFLRMPTQTIIKRGASNTWHEQAPSFCRMARHESPMYESETQSMAQLRRARHKNLQALAIFIREFLVRHGRDLLKRFVVRSQEQQWCVPTGQLSLDYYPRTGQQPSNLSCRRNSVGRNDRRPGVPPGRGKRNDHSGTLEKRMVRNTCRQRVYDLVNCGPRHQYVVRGTDGPIIVHNCENITQATAASFLRSALCKLDNICVIHTHDEAVCEVVDTFDNVNAAKKLMTKIMTDIPDWAEGLPLSVTVESGPFYTK